MRDAIARDATDARADVVAPRDVATDDGQSSEFGCSSDSRCGTGGICLTAYPGGICSRHCTQSRPCGVDGVCDATTGICAFACTSGGGECDQYGGACLVTDESTHAGMCVPSCFVAGAPRGYPACGSATPCDLYSGACTATPAKGAEDGDACAADADCKGRRCITEIDDTGQPTGWIGGYCLSFGRTTNIMQGDAVPQSNCPAGAGTVPLNGQGPGDWAPCFKICNANSDCRVGYQCDHLTPSMSTGNFFTNGICLPIDCAAPGAMCPAGTQCVIESRDGGAPIGHCALDTDAGTTPDAATDAASIDAAD